MTICIKCGKENESCLCNECRQNTNLEELCNQILEYTPGGGENEIWDKISMTLFSKYNFKNIIFAISDSLSFPRKEYMRILCLAGKHEYVAKVSRAWLHETYELIKDSSELKQNEKNRISGLVLAAHVMDYQYADADKLAEKLVQERELPYYCYYTLGDFYTKTRRYEKAEEILSAGLKIYENNTKTVKKIQELLEENEKRKGAPENGNKEYLPAPKEAREEYVKFMNSLGVEVSLSKGSKRNVIPKDQYPEPIETRDIDFDSFVAFDVETTGLSTKIDSIIEIGAIKVLDGKVVEKKEFTFQEFMKPFKRSISSKITELTGITVDDVKYARQMWEVIPDFLDFAGDMVLVGYNSIAFDSQFLARAGRYSERIILNKHFDVMRYLERNAEQLDLKLNNLKLETVSECFGIENQNAHRALSDAITTAKIFMKIKEMSIEKEKVSVDDLLEDLDEW